MAKKAKKVASFFAAALCMKAYAKTGKKRRAKKREKTEKLVPERFDEARELLLGFGPFNGPRKGHCLVFTAQTLLGGKITRLVVPSWVGEGWLLEDFQVNGKSLISDFLKATALKGIVNRTFSELSLAQFYLPTGICGADVPAGAEIKIQVRRIR